MPYNIVGCFKVTLARLARVVIPGIGHHVTQRGVRSLYVFNDSEDKRYYIKILSNLCQEEKLEIHAYFLMDNHVHLLVVPKFESSLRKAIGETHRIYTRKVNFRQKVRGHLFQVRFFSCPLDESHYVSVARYIERNPVRAKMCERACDYEFSSARFHVGKVSSDLLLSNKAWCYNHDDWQRLLMEEPLEIDRIRSTTKTGRPLGNSEFVNKLEVKTNRILSPQKRGPKNN